MTSSPHLTSEQDFSNDTITLRGREVQVKSGFVRHLSLRFYPENPRIYSQVWKDEDVEPTQPEIFEALLRNDHIREHLIPSIRHNGGLIEPVLVRRDVVLEGNSRLAAYRLLHESEPTQWHSIRVRFLPDEMSDDDVFALLGEFHIVGKKDWQPFEQAGYLWRRFKKHNVSEDTLRAELGLTKAKIRHLIHVHDFMLKREEHDPAKWSYYDELLKIRRFDEARELFPDFDDLIVEKIRSQEIRRAVDLRDDLPLIVEAGGKTLKKFIEGRIDFNEAVEEARHRGAGNATMRKLEEFRRWVGDAERDSDITSATQEEKGNVKFNLAKIRDRADALLKKHFKS